MQLPDEFGEMTSDKLLGSVKWPEMEALKHLSKFTFLSFPAYR